MRHYFILNPAAGKADRTAELSEKIHRAYAGLDYEIAVSQYKGNCTELARAAAQAGDEIRIYACGGDGTLNEIVNGIIGCPNAAITSLTAGSGNDFVRNFSDPAPFADPANFLDADESELDLIHCSEGCYSINICSMGIDARIGTQMANYKQLPLVSGPGAYILSTVVNVVKGIHHPYRIEVDGEIIDGRQSLICICNGRWYGGGFHPVPEATLDDGLLDVLIVRSVSRVTVAKVIGDYKKGLYTNYPQYIRHLRCRSIRICCEKAEEINLDGELLYGTDVTFSIPEEKIRFFYPKGLSFSKV